MNECLTDPDVLTGKALVVLIRDGAQVLSNEDRAMLEGFLDVLRYAAVEWATPVNVGETWDRGPVPFHVVFQLQEAGHSVLTRLENL